MGGEGGAVEEGTQVVSEVGRGTRTIWTGNFPNGRNLRLVRSKSV